MSRNILLPAGFFIFALLFIFFALLWNLPTNDYGWYYGDKDSDPTTAVKLFPNDDSFIIIGCKFASNYQDIWISKIDLNGKVMWNNTYGSTFSDCATDIASISDGFLITGSLEGINSSYNLPATILLKLDNNGNQIWNKTYMNSYPEPKSLILPENNEILISGPSGTSIRGNENQMWLKKVDQNGDLIWASNLGEGRKVLIDKINSTSFLVVKQTSSLVVEIFNNNNVKLQSQSYNFTEIISPENVLKTTNNDFLLTASIANQPTPSLGSGSQYDSDIMILKFNSKGDLLWNKSYPGIDDEYPSGITELSNGNFAIIGGQSGLVSGKKYCSPSGLFIKIIDGMGIEQSHTEITECGVFGIDISTINGTILYALGWKEIGRSWIFKINEKGDILYT